MLRSSRVRGQAAWRERSDRGCQRTTSGGSAGDVGAPLRLLAAAACLPPVGHLTCGRKSFWETGMSRGRSPRSRVRAPTSASRSASVAEVTS